MVFGIVKSHGGYVTCYSEVGVGSTFNIYFPALTEDLRPDDLTTTIEMPAGGTETLLLVDDEDAVLTLGAEMLELAGYTVLTAANGEEALEIYRNRGDSISLVILDLVMPGISGRKCLEELLKMDPNAKVLIASGYAADGPAKEARESGAVGFVGKPFDMKRILLAVRKSIDGVSTE
jgi:DNA-binding NtrC family response regulator